MAEARANLNIGANTSEAVAAIKNLQRQISSFYTSINKNAAASQAAVANMQQNLINSINTTGQFSARIKTISTTTESFTNALEKNKLTMGQYFRYAGAASGRFGRKFSSEINTIDKVARERVKDLQTQYIQLGRDANGAMKAIAVRPATLDLNNFTTQTQMAAQKQAIFNRLIQQGSTNLLNWGKNTQWAGRQLMVGFTIPLTIFATTAGRAFMQLEEQAIKFKRVYGDLFTTGAQTEEALAQMRALGDEFTKFGVAVEETVGLAATVAQMGKTGADLTAQVTEATRLSVLGGMSQEEALDTTIGLTNAFGVSVEDLTNKVNFLNAAENQTILSIQDFNEAVPRAGSVVSQLGGDVEDLAFFMASMREGGIEASQAANALKSSLGRLINPTARARDRLKEYGIDVTGIVERNTGDLRGTVMELAYALDELEPLEKSRAIETLFGKFQFARMSTLFQNIIRDGSQASTILDLINSSASDLSTIAGRELGRVEESAATKFTAALERFQAALAPLGEEFLKLATPIIEWATDMLKRFNNLGEGAKGFIVALTAGIGGVMPVMLMLIGLTANLIANIIKGLNRVRTFFQRFRKGTNDLASQTEYLNTEQLESQTISAALQQSHQNLTQSFNVEADALERLRLAYERATASQRNFRGDIVTGTGLMAYGGKKMGPPIKPQGLNSGGVVSVPGTGNTDTVPAMLTPGEAVIPKEMAKRYAPLINAMIAGNIPGYFEGTPGAASGAVAAALSARVQATGRLEAAHGYESSGENLPATLQRLTKLNKRLADMRVVVWQLTEATDLATRQTKVYKTAVEMTVGELAEAAEGQYLYAGGATYPGTAILGTPERNAAINDLTREAGLVGAGDPRMLDTLIDVSAAQGGPAGDGSDLLTAARKAQAENTVAYQNHTAEINQLIAEGELYEQAIREGTSVEQIRADYARQQNKQYMIQADMARNDISREQAEKNAEERLLAIDRQAIPLKEKELLYLQEGLAIREGQHFVMGTKRTDSFGSGVGSDQSRSIARASGGMRVGGERPILYNTGGSNAFTGRKNPPGLMRPGQLQQVLYPSSTQYVTSIADAFANNIDKWSQSSSPSRKTQRSAANMVDGFLLAIKNAYDEARAAGAGLATSVQSGVVSQGGHQVPLLTQDYFASQAPAPSVATPAVPVATEFQLLGGLETLSDSQDELANSTNRVSQENKKNVQTTEKTTKATGGLGKGFMGASFALTGIVSAASMAGGTVGEMAQKIIPFTGAISGATIAVAMLRDTAIGAAVMQRAQTAKGILLSTSTTKLGGGILNLGRAVTAFLGPIGLAIAAFAAVAGVAKLIYDAHQDYKRSLEGLSDVIDMSADKLKQLAELVGAERTGSPFEQNIEIGEGPMDQEQFEAGEELIDQAGGLGEFKEQFADEIDAITREGGEKAVTAIQSLIMRLFGEGFTEEQIENIVAALGIATENLDIFEGIDIGSLNFITEEGIDTSVLRQTGQDSARQYVEAFNAEMENLPDVEPNVGEVAEADLLKEDLDVAKTNLQNARAEKRRRVDEGEPLRNIDETITQAENEVARLEALIPALLKEVDTNVASVQRPLNELGASVSNQIRALSSAFQRGEASSEDFTEGIRAILDPLRQIGNEEARIVAVQEAAENLFADSDDLMKYADDISDVQDLEILSRQINLGIKPDQEYLDTIVRANEELETQGVISATTQQQLAQARSAQTQLIRDAVAAQEDLNEAERINKAQETLSDMAQTNADMQAKIDAYYDLTEAGLSAAAAYKVVGDNALYAQYQEIGAANAAEEDAAAFREFVNERMALEEQLSGFSPTSGGGGGSVDTSPFDQITASLRKFADAQVKVTSGFEDTIAEIENFINVSGALQGQFGGLNQELRDLGLNENLIEMIVGMDPDEYEKRKNDLFIFDDQGTIIGMTAKLQGLNQALNTATIGEFINEQNNITVSVGNQITALQRLTAAGASYQAAYRAVQNTALAAAIATAKSSAQIQAAAEAAMRAQEMMDEFEEINEEELRRERIRDAIVEQNREFSNQAKILNYITRNTNRLSEAQKEAILGDKDLQALILEPGIAPGALQTALDNANKREELELEIKKLTITGQQEIWEDGLSKAMEAFSAQEQELELKFKADTAEEASIVSAAEEEIAKLQFQLDDYEAGIEEIENQEDLINEVYDKRVDSLEDIEDANERITRQQEAQLNIAEALSRGDIAAAAQAAQEARNLSAENAAEQREERLERAREAELARTRSRSGMSRDELQTAIRDIENQIFRIEEDRLEPAEEAIRLADVRKQADIEALTVLGKTKDEWEEIGNRVDLAVVSNYKFVDAMKEALDIVEELIAKLKEGKPELVSGLRIASGGGGGGGGSKKNEPVFIRTLGTDFRTGELKEEEVEPKKLTTQEQIVAFKLAQREEKKLREDLKTLGPYAGEQIRKVKDQIEGQRTAQTYLGQSLSSQSISPSDYDISPIGPEAAAVGAGFQGYTAYKIPPPPPTTPERRDNSREGGRSRRQNNSRSSNVQPSQQYQPKPISSAQHTRNRNTAARVTKQNPSVYAVGMYSSGLHLAMGGFVRRALPGPPSQSAGYAGGGFVRNRISAPPQMFDNGGKVLGPGTSTSDSIPAMLSDGEYVINAKAVERIGVPNLDRLNNQSGRFFQQMKDGVLALSVGGPVWAAAQRRKRENASAQLYSSSNRVSASSRSRRSRSNAPGPLEARARADNRSREERDNSREGGRSRRQDNSAERRRLLETERRREEAMARRISAEARIQNLLNDPATAATTSGILADISGGRGGSPDRIEQRMNTVKPLLNQGAAQILTQIAGAQTYARTQAEAYRAYQDNARTQMAREGSSPNAPTFTGSFSPLSDGASAINIEQTGQNLAQWFASKPLGKWLGDAITAESVGGALFRGAIAALSAPGDMIGGMVLSGFEGAQKIAQGDFSEWWKLIPVVGATRGLRNSFSGIINPENMQDSMFTKAGRFVADNQLFGATDAEGQARARLFGNALNIVADPLAYYGVGLVSRAVRFGAMAGRAGRAGGTPSLAPALPAQDLPIARRSFMDQFRLNRQVVREQAQVATQTGNTIESIIAQGSGSGILSNSDIAVIRAYKKQLMRADARSTGPELSFTQDVLDNTVDLASLKPQELLETAKASIRAQFARKDTQIVSLGPVRQVPENIPEIGGLRAVNPFLVRTSNRRTFVETTNPLANMLARLGISTRAFNLVSDDLYRMSRAPYAPGMSSADSMILANAITPQLGYKPKIVVGNHRSRSNTSKVKTLEDTAFVPGGLGVTSREYFPGGNILEAVMGIRGKLATKIAERKLLNDPRNKINNLTRQNARDEAKRITFNPQGTFDGVLGPLSTFITQKTLRRNFTGTGDGGFNPRKTELVLGHENYHIFEKLADVTSLDSLSKMYARSDQSVAPKTAEELAVRENARAELAATTIDALYRQSQKHVYTPFRTPMDFIEHAFGAFVPGTNMLKNNADTIISNVLTGRVARLSDQQWKETVQEYIAPRTKTRSNRDYQYAAEWHDEYINMAKFVKTLGITIPHTDEVLKNLSDVQSLMKKYNVTADANASTRLNGTIAIIEELLSASKGGDLGRRAIDILSQKALSGAEYIRQKNMAFGGVAKSFGSDTIPAMLTRGEYVIRRPAVESFGVGNLEKINNGTYNDGSVYNYNLSVNVKSDSNPDQIARTVMDQIKRVDSQRIRGNRF